MKKIQSKCTYIKFQCYSLSKLWKTDLSERFIKLCTVLYVGEPCLMFFTFSVFCFGTCAQYSLALETNCVYYLFKVETGRGGKFKCQQKTPY